MAEKDKISAKERKELKRNQIKSIHQQLQTNIMSRKARKSARKKLRKVR